MIILVNRIIIGWLWNFFADLESWWSHNVDLWLGWEAKIFLTESDILVNESISILVHLEFRNLGVTESHNDDGWLRSQTLLVIASVLEAALDSVVKTTEVHDFKCLLWLLLLEQLAESIWETLMAPMAAISLIGNIEDGLIGWDWCVTLTGDKLVTNEYDSDGEWCLTGNVGVVVVAFLVSLGATSEKQCLNERSELHIIIYYYIVIS